MNQATQGEGQPAGADFCPPVFEVAPVQDITTVLQALADPVRLSIVRSLAASPDARHCGSFNLPLTKSTLSHHFRVLRESGLIEQRYEGTRKLTTLRREAVDAVYPGLLASVLSAPEVPAAG